MALLSLSAIFGALCSGVLSDLAGRKPAIILGASLVAVGGLLHTAAMNLWYVFFIILLSLLLYHEQDGTVEQKYRWFWIGVSIFLLNAEVVQLPL